MGKGRKRQGRGGGKNDLRGTPREEEGEKGDLGQSVYNFYGDAVVITDQIRHIFQAHQGERGRGGGGYVYSKYSRIREGRESGKCCRGLRSNRVWAFHYGGIEDETEVWGN